jgi:hypothetical protein
MPAAAVEQFSLGAEPVFAAALAALVAG